VSLRRLRGGELLAGAGAALLAVALFLNWFRLGRFAGWTAYAPLGSDDASVQWDAWSSLGWLVLAFATAAVACAAWLVIATLFARPVAQVVAAAALTSTVGTFAFVALALRTLVFQPGPNDIVVLRYGAYVGLLAALLTAVGGWWAIADERTDAPESAYKPPAPRPAPPPFSS
jgi:hypothetical protein